MPMGIHEKSGSLLLCYHYCYYLFTPFLLPLLPLVAHRPPVLRTYLLASLSPSLLRGDV